VQISSSSYGSQKEYCNFIFLLLNRLKSVLLYTIKSASIKDYIPINEFCGKFNIFIDDIPANGKVYLQIQLKYDDDE